MLVFKMHRLKHCLEILKFRCICMVNGPIEANSSGMLYFFKLKHVPAIYFFKYFEFIHFKRKNMDCNQIWGSPCITIWYNIQQWRPFWIFNYTHTSVTQKNNLWYSLIYIRDAHKEM